VLSPITWSPPGTPVGVWRRALADDAVDLLALLEEVDPALAVAEEDGDFAASVAWPGMTVYRLPALTVPAIFEAAGRDGYEEAAIFVPDAPDLPGLHLAKLLRPLTTRSLAAAPDVARAEGLVGIASRLPAPGCLDEIDLDTATVATIRAAAPAATDIIGTPGWHRQRDGRALGRLDPATPGWDATRALLSVRR
jgi:hypothetical protein